MFGTSSSERGSDAWIHHIDHMPPITLTLWRRPGGWCSGADGSQRAGREAVGTGQPGIFPVVAADDIERTSREARQKRADFLVGVAQAERPELSEKMIAGHPLERRRLFMRRLRNLDRTGHHVAAG